MERPQEFDLIDVWLAVLANKWLLVATVIAGGVLGVAMATFKPYSFDFTTQVQVGSQMTDRGPVVLEDPDAVIAKLNDNYIPTVRRQFAEQNNPGMRIEIRARRIGKTSLLYLQTDASKDASDSVSAMHAKIIDLLVADHDRVFERIQRDLEIRITSGENEITAIDQAIETIAADLEQSNKQKQLLNAELEKYSRAVDSVSNKDSISDNVVVTAVTVNQLLKLREDVSINIPLMSGEWLAELTRLKRDREEILEETESYRLQMTNLDRTRAITLAQQSFNPSGPGTIVLTIIGLLLGGIGGLLLIGVMQFFRAAERRNNSAA